MPADAPQFGACADESLLGRRTEARYAGTRAENAYTVGNERSDAVAWITGLTLRRDH